MFFFAHGCVLGKSCARLSITTLSPRLRSTSFRSDNDGFIPFCWFKTPKWTQNRGDGAISPQLWNAFATIDGVRRSSKLPMFGISWWEQRYYLKRKGVCFIPRPGGPVRRRVESGCPIPLLRPWVAMSGKRFQSKKADTFGVTIRISIFEQYLFHEGFSEQTQGQELVKWTMNTDERSQFFSDAKEHLPQSFPGRILSSMRYEEWWPRLLGAPSSQQGATVKVKSSRLHSFHGDCSLQMIQKCKEHTETYFVIYLLESCYSACATVCSKSSRIPCQVGGPLFMLPSGSIQNTLNDDCAIDSTHT